MSCCSSEKLHCFVNNLSPNSPLFQSTNGTALSRSQYVSLLQDTLVKAGFTPSHYNGHSLRKGFATSASAGQVPDHVISAIGRWTSDCYKVYITTPKSVIAGAQQAVSNPNLHDRL